MKILRLLVWLLLISKGHIRKYASKFARVLGYKKKKGVSWGSKV